MNEFWINNGWHFISGAGLIICILVFSLQYYTGAVKKLDLIVKDIRGLGFPSKEVLEFDKFIYPQGFDPYRLSIFTHLFYTLPDKTKEPELFQNEYFLEQLSAVKCYRNIYKVVLSFLMLDVAFIIAMIFLFGQNIK